MRVQVTWNKPDGTALMVETKIHADDPFKDDAGLLTDRARAAAARHFNQKFGEPPRLTDLTVNLVTD